jgi:prolipoprotein diacylglyceryltransferase
MPSATVLHLAFESLAYAVGGALYRRAARRSRVDTGTAEEAHIPFPGLALGAGAIMGAALGAKVLWMAQFGSWLLAQGADVTAWMQGKTIVGGLLGGWLGVELTKRLTGIRSRTGDAFAVPLCVGMAIGRLGCELAGDEDHTLGIPSPLPFGTRLGSDGLPHHDTALYEIGWLGLILGALLLWRRRTPHAPAGTEFRLVMAAYLSFRVAIDFLKPPYGAGLPPDPDRGGPVTPLQWAALLGAAAALAGLRRLDPMRRLDPAQPTRQVAS